MIRVGLIIMASGTLVNVFYNLFWQATVPWAVSPITIYSLGMSLALPSMTVMVLSIFPQMRGLASSLQSSAQMTIFATVSGLVAPALFHSPLLLAVGMSASAALSIGCWTVSREIAHRMAAARI